MISYAEVTGPNSTASIALGMTASTAGTVLHRVSSVVLEMLASLL